MKAPCFSTHYDSGGTPAQGLGCQKYFTGSSRGRWRHDATRPTSAPAARRTQGLDFLKRLHWEQVRLVKAPCFSTRYDSGGTPTQGLGSLKGFTGNRRG